MRKKSSLVVRFATPHFTSVEKKAIKDKIPEKVFQTRDEFWVCPSVPSIIGWGRTMKT